MKIKVYKVSSFAKAGNGGNPAGVVLDADMMSEEQMKYLANIIGFSETAFVSKSEAADFKVRFFTPNTEVDLCGHATIAAFSLMQQKGILSQGNYKQETKAGILHLSIMKDRIFMEQAKPLFYEIIYAEELEPCLSIKHDDFDSSLPIQVVSTGVRDILVPVKNISILEKLKPDMRKIEEISEKYGVSGLHVFSLGDAKINATCRNFAPLYGIPEESATGTSNGALASYLYRYDCLREDIDDITIEQGNFMSRPSVIKAMLKVKDDDIAEVWIGGDALIIGEEDYQI